MSGQFEGQGDEFAAQLRAAVLRAYGLKPWEAGLAPVPWRIRLWRKLTFAYRRGKAIDWRSYNRAEAEARAAEAAFIAALPDRVQEFAADVTALLPDGMRFEWRADGG